MSTPATATGVPGDDAPLTPEEQARKERLHATALAAESHPVSQRMREEAEAAGGTILDRFVEAKQRKAALERDLRLVKDELAPLEQTLLELFTLEGVSGKRHAATGKLVSITRQIWARAADGNKDAAAREMRDLPDFAGYVQLGFNVQTLSAHFREQAKNHLEETGRPAGLDELLPPPLHGLIELTEDHTLSVRS